MPILRLSCITLLLSITSSFYSVIGASQDGKPASNLKKRFGPLGDGQSTIAVSTSTTNTPSAFGETLYATNYSRDALLAFLGDAYNFAASKFNGGDQERRYFKFDSTSLSMVISVNDTSLGGSHPIGWDTFGNVINVLQDATSKDLTQSTTWVGTITDNNSTTRAPKADILIIPAFKDVTVNSDVVFPPQGPLNNSSDNANSTDSNDVDVGSDLGTNSDKNGKRDIIAGVRPSQLAKRRNNIPIDGTSLTLTMFRSPQKKVLAGILSELALAAYDTFVADVASLAKYAQFTVPLNWGPTLAPAFRDAVFQFQIAGGRVMTRAAMLSWLKTMIKLTEKYGSIGGQRPVLHGQIIDAAGTVLGTYSIGAVIDSVMVPLVSVAGCLAENPDGRVVACLVKDEL